MTEGDTDTRKPMPMGARIGIVVGVVLVIVLALVLREGQARDGELTGSNPVTSVHNDAVADYEAALQAGKPIYVLFHSLSCDPCVEISAVVDDVVPEYAGRVTFVNAITTDSSGQQLASRFSFQYIPTSFFLEPDGDVREAHTGPLSEVELRERLDALVKTESP
ncbi:MAG: thioredoxin family protein [Coriobacteriia bacterium]|nr:thioredoxin family protein [Coriobacteriia bacterium]